MNITKNGRFTAFALTASLALPATALGQNLVDLTFTPEFQSVDVGEQVLISLIATSSGQTAVAFAGLAAIMQWDPTVLHFDGFEVTPNTWFIADFLNDGDGLNDDLLDGDFVYTAVAPLGTETEAPVDGMTVVVFEFTALRAISASELEILPTYGTYTETEVLMGANVDVTGDISATASVTVGGPLGEDLINLSFTPSVQSVEVGEQVYIGLVASSAGSTSQGFAGIDAILQWDETVLHYEGFEVAPNTWFLADFLPDPDGLNDDLLDGDGLFTLFAPLGTEVTAPVGGITPVVFQFTALRVISDSEMQFIQSFGSYSDTEILKLGNVDVTGDLSATASVTVGGEATPTSGIVWHHTNGQTYVWQMLGADLIGQGSPGGVNPNHWYVAGLGDFDGDGYSDLLWRHQATGQTYIWFLDGTGRVGHGSPGAANPNVWEIAGIGDFDALTTTATSTDDILWRNTTTGQTVIWLLDGVQRIAAGSPGGVPIGNWDIANVGDFDGDSHTDILWRNTVTGQVYIWFVNGTQRVGQAAAGAANPDDWRILGVGDFDADATTASRTDDIVWGNQSTGQVVIWLMDGAQRIEQGTVGTVNLNRWFMADVGDLDGDGRADLLWRSSTGGFNAVWFMDGLTVLPTSAALQRVTDQNWTIVGIAKQP